MQILQVQTVMYQVLADYEDKTAIQAAGGTWALDKLDALKDSPYWWK
jgi:hypothetical protein